MVLNVSASAVGLSAATESGTATAIAAATAAASAALVGVMPMGADLDSLEFAAALNAAGASYIGTASEHASNRGLFAGAQSIAAATYTVTDAVNNAALAL